MITEYHRPETLEEALELLARQDVTTAPLAGGTALERAGSQPLEVVDLQQLGLNTVHQRGNFLDLGAMVTLQNLLELAKEENFGGKPFAPALCKAIETEATYNLRQVASIAGTLVAAGGRSPLATVLLAMDVELHIQPGAQEVALGDFLPLRRDILKNRLITSVTLPLNVRLVYDYVARTPADQPIVCAALSSWPSGRVRLALGGFGEAPTLAFDGTETAGVEAAAQSAYSQAQDEWASADYRREIAGVLAKRCLEA